MQDGPVRWAQYISSRVYGLYLIAMWGANRPPPGHLVATLAGFARVGAGGLSESGVTISYSLAHIILSVATDTKKKKKKTLCTRLHGFFNKLHRFMPHAYRQQYSG